MCMRIEAEYCVAGLAMVVGRCIVLANRVHGRMRVSVDSIG